jgi:phosphohistidine phosphatase
MVATLPGSEGVETMDLILWRHAEAIDLELVGDDMDRTLTSRGEKQAARMAAWLDRQLPDGAKVLVSPAVRTEQTARALGRKFKISPALAPLGNVEDLLHLVQWPHAKGCVVVVGHQPTLGQTIAKLMGLTEGECAVKKGSVWWLRYRDREPVSQTVIVTVQSPDLL